MRKLFSCARFQRLLEGIKGLRPTVLFIAYGTNESFEGPAGLQKFNRGLNRLLRRSDRGSGERRQKRLAP